MPVHALLPLKDLVQAKTRLSGLLSPSERRALAQAMAEDVLSMLASHSRVASVTLVSDDPSAHLLADRYGLVLLEERKLGVRGLNAVLEAATNAIVPANEDVILVLHGDIPLFSACELDRVLDCLAQDRALVIGADRHGQGTNLLAFAAPDRPTYRFGSDSCARHRDAAGQRVQVLNLPGLGLDVDEPADLALLLASLKHNGRGYTRDLLFPTELGRRLELALESGLIEAPGKENDNG